MAGNSFGNLFRLTTYGESHGLSIGGIIDGCPAGLKIDLAFIQHELNRRRPGQSTITSQRQEEDLVEFQSGMFEGVTTGTSIAFRIKNKDHHSEDYSQLEDAFRPSHADFTYQEKFGIRDHRGGGRSSARETASRVVAGAIAKLILKQRNIEIHAFVKQVGTLKLEKNFDSLDLSTTDSNMVRCPDPVLAEKMILHIEEVKKQGDTIGGIIQCVIQNAPIGLGEPVFDKLHAVLGHAMLSINAVKGFEIGSGFDSVNFKGSQLNDIFASSKNNQKPGTTTNNSGGIQGGISNGMPIYFNVAFKPVATIMRDQNTITKEGNETVLKAQGRHDPCVLPRAVPIVESMAALVMVDFLLLANCNRM
ncbi:MAG: chorismate synthase [bacterium]|nr:chorismate synthase [bacterium]